ncbi:DUF4112 domain-containing protein [Salinigranum sp. GCM10025319]|uniref:DUF4112 domain-containing protein n=1 Tax=Salinigranum sp. GCM10025319 TaxID=3252687 RepID=UPI0036144559
MSGEPSPSSADGGERAGRRTDATDATGSDAPPGSTGSSGPIESTALTESTDPMEPMGFRDVEAELAALRRLAHALDDLFEVPGTNYRVGLDPLIGLLPGIGDVPTSVASAYIVAQAAALGVPRATLARMLLVVVVDSVVGSVPLVGDLFDAVWKANSRNIALLEARVDDPEAATTDRRFVLVVTALLALVFLAVSLGAVVVAWWALGRLGVV